MTDSKTVQHFTSLMDLSSEALHDLVARAIELKAEYRQDMIDGAANVSLSGKSLGMIFSKSSTRTRVSFEAGMTQLGGHAIFLSPRDTQLGRGEPISHSAKVLGRMCDAIMIRNDSQVELEEFAANSNAPVINGLTDKLHPCQLLADVMTYIEHRGPITGKTVAWIGDGNNVCNSWINAARQFKFKLIVACPTGHEPDAELLAAAEAEGNAVTITTDANAATTGADLVVTDVWASMGQEDEATDRKSIFAAYQVNEDVMQLAADDALFMHCLPAHIGEEVTEGVLEGKQSVVWDEAENRLHAQKALLELLMY